MDKLPEGTKYDTDKLRFDLIPPDVLAVLAKVYTMGAKKYEDHNWRKGMRWSRVIGAIHRHLNAFQSGEDLDPESGLPHLMHAAWGCFTLTRYMQDQRQFDDRWKEVAHDSAGAAGAVEHIRTGDAGHFRDLTRFIPSPWEAQT